MRTVPNRNHAVAYRQGSAAHEILKFIESPLLYVIPKIEYRDTPMGCTVHGVDSKFSTNCPNSRPHENYSDIGALMMVTILRFW